MKMIYMIMLAACCVMGCQPSQGDGNLNISKARQMFDAFNRHDWDAMAASYAEPALFLDPSFGADYVSKSRKETAAKYAAMEKIFSNIYDEVVGFYPSGDKVTVEFIASGTAADGSRFRLPIATVLTFKDGMIVKDATYYDNP